MFEYKVCSLQYFLDEMENYELELILENIEYNTKQNWERTRFQSYIQAQTQTTKQLKLTDIMKFSWDKKEEKDTKVSMEDRKRLIEKMKIIEEKNKI